MCLFTACPSDDDDDIEYYNQNEDVSPTESNGNDAQPIDLGLSVLWADRNFGATMPELQGQGRGWGEVNSKIDLVRYYIFKDTEASKAPSDISGTNFDAARANWGGKWRIPTKTEVEELIRKCKFICTNTNYGSGITVKGPNGNTIFLPCSYGSLIGTSNIAEVNAYWTSTLRSKTGGLTAYYFGFPLISTNNYKYPEGQETTISINSINGARSLVIRPVMDK